MSVKAGDIFILPSRDNDLGVKVLGVAKGIVSYYRVEGSGVIHTLPVEDFVRTYNKSIVQSALVEFDNQLQDLIKE